MSLETFGSSLPDVVDAVLGVGDVVRVDAGNAGAFVVVEEAEYKILVDALQGVIAVATSMGPDE